MEESVDVVEEGGRTVWGRQNEQSKRRMTAGPWPPPQPPPQPGGGPDGSLPHICTERLCGRRGTRRAPRGGGSSVHPTSRTHLTGGSAG
eukprot:gene12788-biopygen12469